MRVTLPIADDVLRELKLLAHVTDRPLTEVADEVLRLGLASMRVPIKQQPGYRESPVDMGEPRVDLTRSLALVAHIDDQEALRRNPPRH